MDQYVDEWNLMAFDYQGPGFSNFTGHNSNVYPSKKLPQATDFNTKQTIDHYKSQLKDPRNIILGLPAYGRSFANVVSGKDHGLGQRFNGSGDGSWPFVRNLPDSGERLSICASALLAFPGHSLQQHVDRLCSSQ